MGLYQAQIVRVNVKYWLIISVTVNALANYSANLNYKAYRGDKIEQNISGNICANPPNNWLITPKDELQPITIIEKNNLTLVDFRLEQATKINIIKYPLYKKLSKNVKIANFCYQEGNIKHCFDFTDIHKSNCKLSIKIPKHFDYQGD